MTWWYVPGTGYVNDQEEGARIPFYGEMGGSTWGQQDIRQVPTYENSWQYTSDQGNRFQWEPGMAMTGEAPPGMTIAPGYVSTLLQWADAAEAGTLKPYEQEQWESLKRQAMSVPLRDRSGLYGGWGPREDDPNAERLLNVNSPDIGHFMLTVRDKLTRGQASAEERALFDETRRMAADWDYRASVPQASDAFNPLGDQFFGALGMLGMGAGAGAALAPLYAGAGLTLGSAAGLAGTAGGFTSMMGEALDNEALRKAGGALGMLGGLSGMGNILSKGISSLGDVLSLGKGLYGTVTKGMGLASGGGGGDSTTGGGMDTNQLGGVLSGIVGAVGTGLSLADAGRYMEQLKSVYGQEQNIRKMIDEAYALAAARYDVYYAQTQEEYQQKQEAYQKAQERYETYYQQTQQEQQQKQAAYTKGEGQTDEDRARQIQTWQEERGKVDSNFQQREAQARQIFTMQTENYGMNRDQALADYQRRLAEAQEDRGREISVFNENWGRHLGSYDRAVAEAQQERGMDLAGYQVRHQIGATLRDPAALKAGAEALYQPLSELARGRISQNAQAEMASRGVTGGGMYANRLSAEAFAPHEQALWNNALNAYLQGQTGALTAYGNVDLARSPEYREMNAPNWSGSPAWTNITMPNFENLPTYTAQNVPEFLRTRASTVPGSVGYQDAPGVPGVTPLNQPRVDTWQPKPYSPGGAGGGAGGGGAGGALSSIAPLVANITKLFGIGSGPGERSWEQLTNYEQTQVQSEINAAMGNNELFGFGGGGGADYSFAPDYSYDYSGGDFTSMPYDDWSW